MVADLIARQSQLQMVEVPSLLRGSVDVLVASDKYFHVGLCQHVGVVIITSQNIRRFTLLSD
jgi:hypothetical protein